MSALLSAPIVEAATVGGVAIREAGYFMTFTAGRGEANRLTAHKVGTNLTFTDAATAVRPLESCRGGTSPRSAICDGSNEGTILQVRLGDRNDTAIIAGAFDGEVYGETGNDVLSVTGTAGDSLFGGTGDDRLTGGPRADRLVGGRGHDRLSGRGGIDTASYADHVSPVRVSLASSAPQGSTGERDVISGVENLIGGRAGDLLTGSSVPNTITGGPGGDQIVVTGGSSDLVVCGPGSDSVRADRSDRLVGCERISRVG